MFSLLRKACLLYRTSKIVFSPFIFAIYDIWIKGVTGAYEGLQGVTRGYKGLQGLQGVTLGDKGWHWVKRDYTNFFRTRTLSDSFSWSILHKNQSWRNLKFLTKTMDSPLWKNSYFAFFINSFFIVFKGFFFYLERQQPLFLDLLLINTKDEKTSTFWPKSWTIPFGKMPILRSF